MDTKITFFPGDDIKVDDEEAEEHKKRCETRMDKLRGFAQSPALIANLIPCCVSSIPRWEFARGGQTTREVGSTKPCGVVEGVRRMLSETGCILSGKNEVAEYLVNREVDNESLRLFSATSMM